MSNRVSFSCYLIGADSLLTECGAVLLDRGHRILGVISDAPRVLKWAHAQGIEGLSASSDYGSVLQSAEYDFLFSITHLRMIPEGLLTTPRRAAINFHDGPLPHYAGLNAPAWALMERAETYGITWHLMTEGADLGDILEQSLFPVSESETSLSLNTQCFAVALESFETLIEKLEVGSVEAVPQNLSDRSYFGRHDRPPVLGLLRWDRSARDLDAFIRALHFGPYKNDLGVARIRTERGIVSVLRAGLDSSKESFAPGLVVEVSDTALVVGTGSTPLRLLSLTSSTGEPLSPMEAARQLQVEVGDTLPLVSLTEQDSLERLSSEVSRSESFWCRRLHEFEPLELPWMGRKRSAENTIRRDVNLVPLTSGFGPSELLTMICAWFARVGGRTRFSIPIRGWGDQGKIIADVTSPHALAVVEIDLDASFHTNLQNFEGQLKRLSERAPWLLDLVARDPFLSSQPQLRKGELSSLEIALETDFETASLGTGVALAVLLDGSGERCQLLADAACVTATDLDEMADQITAMMHSIRANPSSPLGLADLLGPELREKVLVDWNQTKFPFDQSLCVHEQFESQVKKHPDRCALSFESESITYKELDCAANSLAHRLVSGGVMPTDLVGIYVERSVDLVVCVLATLKAGAAYVPLDPDYPEERISLMIEDSGLKTILATAGQTYALPQVSGVEVIRVDRGRSERTQGPDVSIRATDLSYVIYTSGSTGRPKGVMVEHRNVINFFAGMDKVMAPNSEGVWLAVTSLSFDISVLELVWTLTRGFKVVIHRDRERLMRGDEDLSASSARQIDFGLYYWGNETASGRQKYKLLMDGARYADENGFNAVWTPERHFHSFGGPYPNPSVTGSAVAAITQNVDIRAGSCVIPLHHPIRVAEEWAVVDNLSNGRVGLALASGWQPNDFILSSQGHAESKALLLENTEKLRRLWRGESVTFVDHDGKEIEVTTQPRPVQAELPIWLTTAGNPETYREAARRGANVLTHLLGQTLDEVAEKISIYRETLREEGHDPEDFKVTLMLHTFVGEDIEAVKDIVRAPMKDYLGGSVSLVKNFAWAFPAFKRPEGLDLSADDIDLSSLSEDELDAILDFAFERYFESSGLFGTVEKCVAMVENCKLAGIDEVACLVDYGVPTEVMLESLPQLKSVMVKSQENSARAANMESQAKVYSIESQVQAHGVTHLQCTPSMARMMLSDPGASDALKELSHMLVGGEAFPSALASELADKVSGQLINMYGPTETTIWSSSYRVDAPGGGVPIGRPILNTQLYVLDQRLQPVPPEVPGELYVGGAGVVRGYLDRPDLTAERFVDDIFSEEPAARMYRTGDLVRWRRDGVLEFIGRTDHQVKIRGYRIELGEIESRLADIEGVRESVVLVREDLPGDQRIVAYLVTDSRIDSAGVRAALGEHLPAHMIPQHVISLESMPLTPNGKTDRGALPSPDSLAGPPESVYVAPEGELEGRIVEVWQKVLGLERVGTQDNFFDIGGHSLLVVKAHRALKEVCEESISMTDLYRFPTIHSLVEHLVSDNSGSRIDESRDRGARRRDAMQQRRRRNRGKSS